VLFSIVVFAAVLSFLIVLHFRPQGEKCSTENVKYLAAAG
jgi:hypothetical protein